MHTHLFLLTQDHPDIGEWEIKQLLKPVNIETHGKFVLCTNPNNLYTRIAYTHAAYKILWSGNEFVEPLFTQKSLPYKVTFDKKFDNKQIAMRSIFRSLDKPIVDLTNPQIIYFVCKIQDTYYVCELLDENQKTFHTRKPQDRPFRHPSSMQHKLARAMINLSGIQKGTIYDPFCGTGGFLLEGITCNLHVIGSDIDPKMISGVKKNIADLQKKFPCEIEIAQMDALKTDIKADVIISDLPYGKNTKNISADLYDKFFAHMKKEKLAKKVVLCFSKAANAMQYVEKYKYKLIVCFDYFIHDSLTRQIFVLELE